MRDSVKELPPIHPAIRHKIAQPATPFLVSLILGDELITITLL
jgi:hypothetical protein